MRLALRSFQPAGARLPAGQRAAKRTYAKTGRPRGLPENPSRTPQTGFGGLGGGICCGRKTGTVKYRAVLNGWRKETLSGDLDFLREAGQPYLSTPMARVCLFLGSS